MKYEIFSAAMKTPWINFLGANLQCRFDKKANLTRVRGGRKVLVPPPVVTTNGHP